MSGLLASAIAVVAVVAAVVALLALWPAGSIDPQGAASAQGIALAVMGDSNSHSYQDGITFPAGATERGGALRAQTFQWTEVIARLRGQQLDQGPWVTWGRPGLVALAREAIGLPGGRALRKQDYLYNFANSGAACKNLMGDRLGQRFRQAPRLVALMDQAPQRWSDGVVIIAIGANDWGAHLDAMARERLPPELVALTDYCKRQIGAAIALIHARHPGARILVVGIANEADDPSQFDRYRSASEMANIDAGLDHFNDALRQLALADPRRVAFVDPYPWFVARWGRRGPQGEPTYRTLVLGPTLQVTNTAGDTPDHALLADGHAGLVWNVLWAQEIVAQLRQAFGVPVPPITDAEALRFIDAQRAGNRQGAGALK